MMDSRILYRVLEVVKALEADGDRLPVIVRAEGKDFVVRTVERAADGVLGEYLVIVCEPLNLHV
jgi:hypothetical protein